MSAMTIGDLSLVYQDLLANKMPLLAQTASFGIFESGVVDSGARLLDYAKAERKTPLADELRTVDRVHDQSARAVHYYCRGMAQSGLLEGAVEELLAQVLNTFVPSLSITGARYEEEAAAAYKKREALQQLEAQLSPFTIAPGLSLYQALDTHVSAAEKIGALLSNRASESHANDAAVDKDAAVMRAKSIGILNRLQESIETEVEFNGLDPKLPGQIFAYWEQMQSRAADKKSDGSAEVSSS